MAHCTIDKGTAGWLGARAQMVSVQFGRALHLLSDNQSPKTLSASANTVNIRDLPLLLGEDPVLEELLKVPQDFTRLVVADSVPLDSLLEMYSAQKQCTLPKRETLGADFTDSDYQLLCNKLRSQHAQFLCHQLRDIERKVARFKTTFPRFTVEELFVALEEAEWAEDDVAMWLTRPDYLNQLRCRVAERHTAAQCKIEQQPARKGRTKTKQRPAKDAEAEVTAELPIERSAASAFEPAAELEMEPESTSDSCGSHTHDSSEMASSELSSSPDRQRPASRNVRALKLSGGRLRLDDAVAKVSLDPESGMEGWSNARIHAYQIRDQNPNAYYYRFNAPGEQQRNGAWTPEEHRLFMERLKEVGADGQWGIFSMVIPGRVGYQCSNYYRKLIESGTAKDDSYAVDGKGKAHFIRGRTRPASKRTAAAEGSDEDEEAETLKIVKRDRPQKNAMSESTPPRRLSITQSNRSLLVAEASEVAPTPRSPHYENPLPDFIDAITRMPVVRPAISPYGHVLSYDTWLRCILQGDRRNVCPLTNQPLQKRQLIFLTWENIEMYRDRIIGMCDSEEKKGPPKEEALSS